MKYLGKEQSRDSDLITRKELNAVSQNSGYNETYTKNGIVLSASPQAVNRNGLRITTAEARGLQFASVSMGPLMAEAFGKALKTGTDSQASTWQQVPLGFGVQGLFWKVGRIVGFTTSSITTNYGNGKMGEKIPVKYRPKHRTSFAGQCINNNNFAGGFVIELLADGSIHKFGTGGHQEYHCSGVYLADNDL